MKRNSLGRRRRDIAFQGVYAYVTYCCYSVTAEAEIDGGNQVVPSKMAAEPWTMGPSKGDAASRLFSLFVFLSWTRTKQLLGV